ncbi:sialin-like [Amphiura filiformis]|uniref:sialin-like n=1 Tax=Amphiura filiformis TaxID=82378 RepID=UPI003B213035
MATKRSSAEDEGVPLLGAQEAVSSRGCVKARHALAILGFLGFFNVYCMRVNLSVALVAMANYTSTKNETLSEECSGNLSTHITQGTAETYHWDENTQNQILSAFFYGYLVTQIPGGWLAGKYGGKWLFGLGVLCTTILTLLTPLAASAGTGWLIAVRVLEGLGEGVTFPAMHAMWGSWAPPLERSKLATFTYAGSHMGTIISSPISGVLCDSNFLGGWPAVFYLFGALGLVWFVFWTLLAHDTPAQHPRISPEEREYIEKSIGHRNKRSLSVPILSVFTSVPMWAIIISHFANNWGFYTLLTNLPNYLKNVLKFDLSQSGFLSGLPYIFLWLAVVFGGQVADYLRMNNILTTGQTRKLFNNLGLSIPAISLVLVGYVGCDRTLAIVFLCVACLGAGLTMSGCNVNHLDIAPQYAGILMGITNCGATIPGFAGPAVVGALTENNNTISQWRIVFWICFGIYMFGIITYTFMASGVEQPWAKEEYTVVVNASEEDQEPSEENHHVNPDYGR